MKAHKTARLGLSGCRGRGSAGLFLIRELVKVQIVISYTLWLFNIAMENGPFIDGLPIKNGDFPWLC
jgi:hypothetical protein